MNKRYLNEENDTMTSLFDLKSLDEEVNKRMDEVPN